MTTTKKNKTNLFYIIIGLFFGICFLWINSEEISERDLENKTVIVSRDIRINYGLKSKYEYQFWVNEYQCSFVIKTAGGIAAHWNNLDSITKSDTLIIKMHKSRLSDLDKQYEEIPIYSLEKNNDQIFDLDSYNTSQNTLNKRWRIISLILGILFVFRGLTIISSKTAYVLAGLSAAIIITMRFLNIWW